MQDNANLMSKSEVYRSYSRHAVPDDIYFAGQMSTLVADSAKGATLFMSDGREVIDFASGHFGYSHPVILQQVSQQLQALPLSSRVFYNRQLAEFVQKLAQMTPEQLDVVYPCNSESEAIDGALKLARGYHYPHRHRIVAVDGLQSYATLGSRSVSSANRFAAHQETPVEVKFTPYGDSEHAKAVIDHSVAAVIVEPAGVFAGATTLNASYLQNLAQLCRTFGVLLIVDESSTGLGHSGTMFVVEQAEITPDILILGKTLGGGVLPMAAYVTRWLINEKVYGHRNPALHGSTTGGNPAACVAATAVLSLLEQPELWERISQLSDLFAASLDLIHDQFQGSILNYRVQGLIGCLYVADEQNAFAIKENGLRYGILCAAQKTLRLEGQVLLRPPLIISLEEMTKGLQSLQQACEAVYGN